MRRFAVVGVAVSVGFLGLAPGGLAASARVAALQVAVRAHGVDPGPIDGGRGSEDARRARLLPAPARTRPGREARTGDPEGARRTGSAAPRPARARAGAVGWDVAVLEFRLRRYGLPASAVDGRFTGATSAALRRYQRRYGLVPDGIAGPRTYRILAIRGPVRTHVVSAGESFFSIAARYRVSPWQLARANGLTLTRVIVPGQRLVLPAGARVHVPIPVATVPSGSVRAAIDHWAAVYGVDARLARALAWMESGFQEDVVSSVGAIGVMQLLPETWDFVDTVLLGVRTPRTYDGNVRAGVRYLRWQLDQFGGDVHLALAGWYQGARAVREIGLYDDTKLFVRIVLQLYGTV